MKYLYLFIFCFLLGHDCFGQQWIWAKTAICGHDPNDGQDVLGFATDPTSHALYSTGEWGLGYPRDTLQFGNTLFIDTTGTGVFLVKYDTSGNVVWAKNAMEAGYAGEKFTSVTTDRFGNIYLVTTVNSSALLADTYTITNTSAPNNSDACILKYRSDGSFAWLKTIHGIGNEGISEVAVDGKGNPYVVGTAFGDYYIFDNDSIHYTNSFRNGYFAKFASSGNIIFIKYGINALMQHIVFDGNSTMYIAGEYFDSTLVILNDTINTPTATQNAFIAKFDTSGNILWAKASWYDNIGLNSFALDENNNLYFTGTFGSSTAHFGNQTLQNPYYSSYGYYLCKLNSDGDVK